MPNKVRVFKEFNILVQKRRNPFLMSANVLVLVLSIELIIIYIVLFYAGRILRFDHVLENLGVINAQNQQNLLY